MCSNCIYVLEITHFCGKLLYVYIYYIRNIHIKLVESFVVHVRVCVCVHMFCMLLYITTLSTTAGLVRYRWYHVYMLAHVQTQKLYMLNPVGSTMCSCTPCPVLLVPLLYVPPDGRH